MCIQSRLFELKDEGYKEFNSKLIPTVNPDTVIGVRTPELRKLAKEIYAANTAEIFLRTLPHKYYEENNLHGFIIEKITDYNKCVDELNCFLPYVDNWATCDMMTPRCLKKYPDRLMNEIKWWLNSKHTYTVRFGIKLLMSFYLDELFEEKHLSMVSSVKSEEYYVRMMIAWYFATALAKQYDSAVPYLENKRLDVWVHNKTIQKAVESYRITDNKKEYLKTLRLKNK